MSEDRRREDRRQCGSWIGGRRQDNRRKLLFGRREDFAQREAMDQEAQDAAIADGIEHDREVDPR